jgi:hypothetical protein
MKYMRNSKLIEEKKERELLRLSRLTPEEQLREQVRHNAQIKKLFFAGLSSRGFSREEIDCLWKQRRSSRS